ncbi:hypothetical protein U9M48_005557 [Paspalum notatum var. saurae]|uniref:RING-type domain-containing protein n=1 Tax=Paspalum notatum var. saurae TaxID=547442 RepID=A0AAQ3SK36_PASNO
MWALANFAAVCELIHWVVRCRHADLEEALLLESIPSVPYQPPSLPSGHGGGGAADVVDDDDDGREECVIRVTPYEAGDPCSVLPACGHRFHTHCVLQWLRTKRTCPLCRAALTMPGAPPHGDLNAAELMV